MATVFIVTAVHNPGNSIKTFLKCCLSQTHKQIRIVIVDDGSTDGTTEFIQTHYPNITLLHGDGKLWWGGSMNLAVNHVLQEATDQDYILTINDDCQFTINFVNSILSTVMKHPKSIIGSIVINKDTSKMFDGPLSLNWSNGKIYSPHANKGTNEFENTLFKTEALTTRGAIYPVILFNEVGNFDSKTFPHHIVDIDLSLRAKRAGYNLYIHSQSQIQVDVRRTGLSISSNFITTKHSLIEVLNILFSRRSSNNLIDNYKFIFRHCPTQYRAHNYARLLTSALAIFTSATPLFQIKNVLRPFYLPLFIKRKA